MTNSENKQICCTNAEVSSLDLSRELEDVLEAVSPSWKRLFRDVPRVGGRLFSGLPGMLPSTTIGLLAAILT